MATKAAVIGIDLGTHTSSISYVGKGVVDMVQNEVSQRTTPTLVGFTNKERLLGDSALALIKSNLKNTCRNFKHYIGRNYSDPDLESELAWALCPAVEAADGTVGFEVGHQDEQQVYTMPQVLGMYLTKLKETTEAWTNGKVADVVLAVPSYFSDVHRQAVLDACDIANINCLRLMNETTATALNYGIYRTNEFEEATATNVCFVSMGYSTFSASVVSFVKGKLEVRSDVVERGLGGRDQDSVLVDFFSEGFAAKHKVDPRKNGKARFKLEEAVEKTKKILSANYEAGLSIECLIEDYDISGSVSREKFEELCAGQSKRVQEVIAQAVADSGLTCEDLHFVEIVGGATRVPWVQNAILEATKAQELSRTLNADESVARGAALQAAMLSPLFKVRDFQVTDFSAHAIDIGWQASGDASAVDGDADGDAAMPPVTTEGTLKTAAVFPKWSAMNTLKLLSFSRSASFELNAMYPAACTTLLPGTKRSLGRYVVQLPEEQKAQPSTVKVRVKLSLNGVFSVDSAELVEQEQYDEVVKEKRLKAAAPAEDGVAEAPAAAGDDGAAEKPATDAAAEGEAAKPKEEEFEWVDVTKVKTRTKRVDLVIEKIGAPGMTREQIMSSADVELKMQASGREIRETMERRNDLEAYIFDMRAKLAQGGKLHEYIEVAISQPFVESLASVEDWLNDNWDGAKVIFEEKLLALRATTSPAETRLADEEQRPDAANVLTTAITVYRAQANAVDGSLDHISAEEKAAVIKRCDDLELWLSQQQGAQAALPRHQDPVLSVGLLKTTKQELSSFATPILNKPKPKPKKKEEAPAEPAGDAEVPKEGEGASEGASEAPPAGDAAPADDLD